MLTLDFWTKFQKWEAKKRRIARNNKVKSKKKVAHESKEYEILQDHSGESWWDFAEPPISSIFFLMGGAGPLLGLPSEDATNQQNKISSWKIYEKRFSEDKC